jgi:hypothetical protein
MALIQDAMTDKFEDKGVNRSTLKDRLPSRLRRDIVPKKE